MPKSRKKKEMDRQLEAAMAEQAAFRDRAQWKKSKKGNYWREWGRKTVTLFKRDGFWRWCIADADSTDFSPGAWEKRSDARSNLAYELGVGIV